MTDWGGANSRFLGLVSVGSTIIRSNGIETACHQKNPSNAVKHITHMQKCTCEKEEGEKMEIYAKNEREETL